MSPKSLQARSSHLNTRLPDLFSHPPRQFIAETPFACSTANVYTDETSKVKRPGYPCANPTTTTTQTTAPVAAVSTSAPSHTISTTAASTKVFNESSFGLKSLINVTKDDVYNTASLNDVSAFMTRFRAKRPTYVDNIESPESKHLSSLVIHSYPISPCTSSSSPTSGFLDYTLIRGSFTPTPTPTSASSNRSRGSTPLSASTSTSTPTPTSTPSKHTSQPFINSTIEQLPASTSHPIPITVNGTAEADLTTTKLKRKIPVKCDSDVEPSTFKKPRLDTRIDLDSLNDTDNDAGLSDVDTDLHHNHHHRNTPLTQSESKRRHEQRNRRELTLAIGNLERLMLENGLAFEISELRDHNKKSSGLVYKKAETLQRAYDQLSQAYRLVRRLQSLTNTHSLEEFSRRVFANHDQLHEGETKLPKTLTTNTTSTSERH